MILYKDPTQTGGSTSYYRNSDSGNILAWLIEYLKSEKKDIAVKTLYDIWIKNFEKIDSSLEKFMRIFFRKFYEQKVFEKFIICYLLRVINETYVKDWTNLLNYLTHPFNQTVEDLKLYMKIWEESIAELDEESRKMFLYRLKLDIEVKVESKVVNYKSYEEIRFEIRENHEQICVEGICESCNYSNIYKVNLIYFCKRVQIQWASPIYYDCQDCKEKKAKVATLEYTR